MNMGRSARVYVVCVLASGVLGGSTPVWGGDRDGVQGAGGRHGMKPRSAVVVGGDYDTIGHHLDGDVIGLQLEGYRGLSGPYRMLLPIYMLSPRFVLPPAPVTAR